MRAALHYGMAAMSTPLRIAVVCPLPWPPSGDVTWRIAHEAEALAARGHSVTVLASGRSPEQLAEGRAALERAAEGDVEAVLAAPGTVRVLVVGRAIKATARRQVVGPLDLASGVERALAGDAFDIVHLHEPLTPVPLMASLRHTGARAVVTFHRVDPPTPVALFGPLAERSLDRADARVAVSPRIARTLTEVLPAEYEVIPAGVDADAAGAAAARGVMVVSRGRDRAGLRFGLTVARLVGPDAVAPLYVLGPREATWRTRAAVPKALRGVATVLRDDEPDAWRRAAADVAVVLAVAADDLTSPLVTDIRAGGRRVVAPRTPDNEALAGDDPHVALVPAFTADAWVDATRRMLDASRDATLPAGDAGLPTWDAVAERLEGVYQRVLASPAKRHGAGVVLADLRVRPAADADPEAMAAACVEVGLDVIAVATPRGVADAAAIEAVSPPGLTVIAGREIATADGVVVGLFLRDDVPDGDDLRTTLEAVRAQGGITLVPHPEDARIPPPALLRDVSDLIDCREMATGALGTAGVTAVRDAQALGLVVSAGSAADGPRRLGGVGMVMRGFDDAATFLESLADAEPALPRRRRRARARSRRRARGS